MAMAPDGRTAWVFGSHPGQSAVAVFDALTGDQHPDVQFRQSEAPRAAAFSRDGTRAFVANDPDLDHEPARRRSGKLLATSSWRQDRRPGAAGAFAPTMAAP